MPQDSPRKELRPTSHDDPAIQQADHTAADRSGSSPDRKDQPGAKALVDEPGEH